MKKPSSVIEAEFLYKMQLAYRQTIPKNETFYMVVFVVKFFPLILLTHAIELKNYDSLFTLSKVLRSLTIINNVKIHCYPALCGVIYFLILFLLSSIGYIFYSSYSQSKKKDIHTHTIPLNAPTIQTSSFFKFTVWLFLLVILFYQHLIEVLYFGIFKIFTSVSPDKITKVSTSYSNDYLIAGLNIFFIVVLVLLFYAFVFLSSTKTIEKTFGYQSSAPIISTLINVFYFSLQGTYTTGLIYSENGKEKFPFYICFGLCCFLGCGLIFDITYNKNYFSDCPIPFLIDSIKHACLVSSILELYLYYLVKDEQRVKQNYYIFKFMIVSGSGVLITWSKRELKYKFVLKALANEMFTSTKECSPLDILWFYRKVKQTPNLQDKLVLILTLVRRHEENCQDSQCFCREVEELYHSMNDTAVIKKILRKFELFGGKKISELIINNTNDKAALGKLLFCHCDMLYSINKNYSLVLYLSQYYLMRQRIYYGNRYMIYEVNYLAFGKKQSKLDEKIKTTFLKENFENEKIASMILFLVSKIEQFLLIKSLKDRNPKVTLSCEDFLVPLRDYTKRNGQLMEMILDFSRKQHFDNATKIKFFIYYYLKLFNITLPKKIKIFCYPNKSVFPSYDSIYDDYVTQSGTSSHFMIISLNKENRFIIKYISTILSEKLFYTVNELIGADFHERMIPQFISKYHNVVMKEFVISGFCSYSKKSYVLNKKFQMFPVEICSRVIPTINSLYSLVINLEEFNSTLYSRYDVILDPMYHFLYLSESFEDQFFFSIQMLTNLKINFCDFFGLNQDLLDKYFHVTLGSTPQETTKNIASHKLPLASPSYRGEEFAIYRSIDFDKIFSFNEGVKLVKDEKVGKEKVENYLRKLSKNIEELGLEKEWKLLINILIDKIHSKITTGSTMSLVNINTNNGFKKKPKLDRSFSIKIKAKEFGPIQYYLSTISEVLDESIPSENSNRYKSKNYTTFSDEFNAALKGGNLETFLMSSSSNNVNDKRKSGFYNLPSQTHSLSSQLNKADNLIFEQKMSGNINTTNSNLNTIKEESSVFVSNSQANFLGTTESNLSRIVKDINPEAISKKKDLNGLLKNSSTVPRRRVRDPTQESRKMSIINYFQVILGAIVFALNGVNLVKNFSSINFSVNIFKANSYSFMMLNDILFGSIDCLNYCYVEEKVQEDEEEFLLMVIGSVGDELMKHYYYLSLFVSELKGKKELKDLYQILNGEDEFISLLSNWNVNKYNSTLAEEIYLIYYSMKTFITSHDPAKRNCRVAQFFLNSNYKKYQGTEDPDLNSTFEEKFLFYISNNIITSIINKLNKINSILNTIFQDNNNSSKIFFQSINFGILFSAFFLYILILISICRSKKTFRKRFKELVGEYDNEDIFFEDVRRFKKLLENFDRESANEYSNFKNEIHSIDRAVLGLSRHPSTRRGASKKNLVKISNSRSGSKKNILKRIKKDQFDRVSNVSRNQEKKKKVMSYKTKHQSHPPEDEEEKETKRGKIRTEPEIIFYMLVLLFFVCIVYLVIEIVIIVRNSNFYETFYLGQVFASNFLWRFPKLNEIILYSYISATFNDFYYIRVPTEEFPDSVYSNYYHVKIRAEDNSFYQKFGDSNFAYLYYQLTLIRENIENYMERGSKGALTQTSKNEMIYREKNELCPHSNFVYFETLENDMSALDLFSQTSAFTKICKSIGNGMNLSGVRQSLNLMQQHLVDLFVDFQADTDSNRNLRLLQSSKFLRVVLNNNRVIQRMNSSFGRTVLNDMNHLTKLDMKTKITLAITSLVLSCGVILVLLWMTSFKLMKLNEVILKALNIMNNFSQNLDI